MHDVTLSKQLTTLLRHKALEDGIKIDRDGWALLSEVLGHINRQGNALTYTESDVRDVVRLNDKQRFEVREKAFGLQIRATRGHTMRLRGRLRAQIKPLNVIKPAAAGVCEVSAVSNGSSRAFNLSFSFRSRNTSSLPSPVTEGAGSGACGAGGFVQQRRTTIGDRDASPLICGGKADRSTSPAPASWLRKPARSKQMPSVSCFQSGECGVPSNATWPSNAAAWLSQTTAPGAASNELGRRPPQLSLMGTGMADIVPQPGGNLPTIYSPDHKNTTASRSTVSAASPPPSPPPNSAPNSAPPNTAPNSPTPNTAPNSPPPSPPPAIPLALPKPASSGDASPRGSREAAQAAALAAACGYSDAHGGSLRGCGGARGGGSVRGVGAAAGAGSASGRGYLGSARLPDESTRHGDVMIDLLSHRHAIARGGAPLLVPPSALARAPDSNVDPGRVGVLLRTAPEGSSVAASSRTAFVCASHIGLSLQDALPWARLGGCPSAGVLRLTLDETRLPPGLSRPTAEQVVPMAPGEGSPPELPLCRCGHRTVIAWGVNLLMLVGSSLWILFIFLSLHLLPENLEATALTREEWYASFNAAFLFSLVTSFLLVDGVKICLLSMMSLPEIEAALKASKLKKALIRKPLRRLHKLLDMLL